MATKIMYQIVGRYMDGKEVTGYHLQSIDTGKSGRYTREQIIYLVGRGQITNCSGQLYQDKVLLRGVGISLESLPVQQENGSLSRTESVGKVRRGADASDVMTQLIIVASITSGRDTIGYILRNAGGQTKPVDRQTVLKLASSNRLGNARAQEYKGKILLRGINVNLNELPHVTPEQAGIATQNKAHTSVNAAQHKAHTPVNPNIIKLSGYDEVMSATGEKARAVGLLEFMGKLSTALKQAGIKFKVISTLKSDEYSNGYVDVNIALQKENKFGGICITTSTLDGTDNEAYIYAPGLNDVHGIFSRLQNASINFKFSKDILRIANAIVQYMNLE